MGIEYYKYVWKNYKKQAGHKLVMLALAEFTNDETGECWPSIATLAEMAGISDRQVQRILTDLKQSGDVQVDVAHGRANTSTYRIIRKGDAYVTIIDQKGDVHDTFYPLKDDADVTFNSEKNEEKVTSSAEKVTSSALKGDTHVTRTTIEPIEPISISFADAKAPPAPQSHAREPTEHQRYFAKVCEIVGWDHQTITKDQKGQVAQTVGILKDAKYTQKDLCDFGKEVWANDWRWRKNRQHPTLNDLRTEIGKLRKDAKIFVPEAAQSVVNIGLSSV